MRIPNRRVTLAIGLLLGLGLGAVPILASPLPDRPPSSVIRVTMQGEDAEGVRSQLVLERGAYQIEVYGATALVSIVQEFRNPAEEDLTATYGWSSEERHQPERLYLEMDGGILSLGIEKEAAPASSANKSPRRNTMVPGQMSRLRVPASGAKQGRTPITVRGEPFEVGGERSFSVRTTFRARLAVERGRFRLTLPSLREGSPVEAGQRPVLPVSVTVTLHAPLLEPTSPTHELLVAHEGDLTIVELVKRDGLEDRSFVLDFKVAEEDEATFAGFVGAEIEGRSQVSATFLPPELPREEAVRPKQVLFILDTSGSMKGSNKLDQAREALESCLEKLQTEDRFNILRFSTGYAMLRPEPLEPTDPERELAQGWLDAIVARGGTTLLPALGATLEQPADAGRHRMIILITDGKIADEAAVLELLEEKLKEGRLFVVGIGPSPNRDAILRLAEYGRGAATFAGSDRELQDAVVELFDAISQPLAWDLLFDWGGADVEEISPSRLPDLYADRPVKVLAWVRGDLPSELRLRVSTMYGERDYFMKLPPRQE